MLKKGDSGSPAILLTIVIHPSERRGGRDKHVCLFPDYPPRKRQKGRPRTLYLGSLCARLDECANNILRSEGRYDVVTHAGTCFLQIFL